MEPSLCDNDLAFLAFSPQDKFLLGKVVRSSSLLKGWDQTWRMFLIEVEANLSQDLSCFRGETINRSHQRVIYTNILLH